MSEQALALVVRGTDWSETSRITTLFTREFGKVRGLAKGGRRLRSNFEIAFDLLTVCNVVFLRKAHGGLDLLIEARVAERFPHLRTDLSALNIGYYIAELLSDGTQDYDPHPTLFDAALGMLRDMASGGHQPPVSSDDSGGPTPPARLESVSAFELVWLQELGYSPQLDECAVCAGELPVSPTGPDRVAFSPESGGVVCPRCQPTARDRRPLSAPAWAALKALRPGPLDSPVPREPPSPLPPAVRREVRQHLGQTVGFVLGRRPRMLTFVDGA